MSELLTAFVPLFAFMLIPVWIPLVAHSVGAVADRVVAPRVSPALRAVDTAKLRSAERRTVVHTAPRHRSAPNIAGTTAACDESLAA